MSEPAASPAEAVPLDELRAEIDRIDTDLHGLVMRRADIVASIGRMKENKAADNGFFRPSREAEVVRRLLARHRGPLANTAVVRLWRELLGAMLCLQGSFAVAVLASPRAPGLWTLAHDHFGGQAAVNSADSVGAVLRAVTDGQAAVGVLPLPRADDRDPWWPQLLALGSKMPRVVARLPFCPPQVVQGVVVEAFVVGRVPLHSTGNYRSLVAIETGAKISSTGLTASLKAAELELDRVHAWQEPRRPAAWLHLLELNGYVPDDDPRLASLGKLQGQAVRQVRPLGGYAAPLRAAEPASS